MVTETRKFLEQQFAKLRAQREAEEADTSTDNDSLGEDDDDTAYDAAEEATSEKNDGLYSGKREASPSREQGKTSSGLSSGEKQGGDAFSPDPYLQAPRSFRPEFAEAFKALPGEMRKYLHEREGEAAKSFSRLSAELQNRRWVDEAFSTRRERMSRHGINSSRDWIAVMAGVDDALERNPRETLQALARCYGVSLDGGAPSGMPDKVYFDLQNQISSLENSLSMYQNKVFQQADAQACSQLESFRSEKSEAGSLKHPYFDEVRLLMADLIERRMANSYEDAYEQAVWLNGTVRSQLLQNQAEALLRAKTEEAQRAKQAGFSAKGKPAEVSEEHLTTRQFLEKYFSDL